MNSESNQQNTDHLESDLQEKLDQEIENKIGATEVEVVDDVGKKSFKSQTEESKVSKSKQSKSDDESGDD